MYLAGERAVMSTGMQGRSSMAIRGAMYACSPIHLEPVTTKTWAAHKRTKSRSTPKMIPRNRLTWKMISAPIPRARTEYDELSSSTLPSRRLLR